MITYVGELKEQLEKLDPDKKIFIETTRYVWNGKFVSTKEIVEIEEDEESYIIKSR